MLIDSLPSDSLENLEFSVFGFGDTAYEKFNAMARKLYQRLLQLGGKVLSPRGLGDDSKEGGYIVDLIDWKTKLFTKLSKICQNFEVYENSISGLRGAPGALVQLEKVGSMDSGENEFEKVLGFVDKNREASPIFEGKLAEKERMTERNHFQDVELLSVDMKNGIKHGYNPGDVAVIFPSNGQEKVKFMLEYFGLKGNEKFKISNLGNLGQLQINVKDLFSRVLRLSETPPFFFFKLFQFYTKDQIYADRINEMRKQYIFNQSLR